MMTRTTMTWRYVALASILLNAILAGLVLSRQLRERSWTSTGELIAPMFGFGLAPDELNTRFISLALPDGGTDGCRMPTVDGILESPQNRYGNPPAVVTVEMGTGGGKDPSCRIITTVREGWVATPK
jgi:hypothetical protein